jgi:SAM-dependent methyltransferase
MATKRAAPPSARRRTTTAAERQGSGPDPATFPTEAVLTPEVVCYGPDIPDDRSFRLMGSLGTLEGKRVLELGSGAGHNAVALARQGAKVITVDPSWGRLERVREAADRSETKVELHQGDPAEIAFVRAETIDAALSVYTLATVADLDRVFRQVHRVLRREAPLIFSLPHPAFTMTDPASEDPLRLTRSYFDREPRPWSTDDAAGHEYVRNVGELLTSLLRANFRIDTVLEPAPLADAVRSAYWTPAMELVPSTLIIRARKEGL